MIIKYKFKQILLIIVLSTFILCIFYPQTIIKEFMLGQANALLRKVNAPISIYSKKFSINWLTGIKLEQIAIYPLAGGLNEKYLDEVSLRLSILPLLLGRISLDFDMLAKNETLQGTASLSLFKLLWDNSYELSAIDLNIHNVDIKDYVEYSKSIILNNYGKSLIILSPLIEKLQFSGQVDADIHYKLSKTYNSIASIKLKNANFNFPMGDLDMPPLSFTNFQILVSNMGGILKVKDGTELQSKDLSLALVGDFVHQDINAPSLDLLLKMRLSQNLEKYFGFLVPQFLSCPSSFLKDGFMNVHLSGKLDRFTCINKLE